MEALLVLEQSAPGQFLRTSWWAYPLVNVVHVLGLAALYGSVVALDLRLLGVWRAVPRDHLSRPLVAVAAAGLAVALVSGALLFAARAAEYAAMPVFLAKIGFVALGLVNAAAMRVSGLEARRPRLAGAVSLVAWTGAIVLGRLIGYGAL